jgi:hypothetical protein
MMFLTLHFRKKKRPEPESWTWVNLTPLLLFKNIVTVFSDLMFRIGSWTDIFKFIDDDHKTPSSIDRLWGVTRPVCTLHTGTILTSFDSFFRKGVYHAYWRKFMTLSSEHSESTAMMPYDTRCSVPIGQSATSMHTTTTYGLAYASQTHSDLCVRKPLAYAFSYRSTGTCVLLHSLAGYTRF